jgi:prepilin-type N-terminal cleavage/methylation domain-containing protein
MKKGLTLIEALVVVTILTILVAILAPVIGAAYHKNQALKSKDAPVGSSASVRVVR